MPKEEHETHETKVEEGMAAMIKAGMIKPDETGKTEPPPIVKPAQKQGDDDDDGKLTLPKRDEPIRKPSKDESAAILKQQRDEARKKAEELQKIVDSTKSQDTIIAKIKAKINKDEIDEADLDTLFANNDFTEREKAALEKNLKEANERLKFYDVTTSKEYQENFVKPIEEASKALSAEIVHISKGKPIFNEKAAEIMQNLVKAESVTQQDVKIAINQIRDAYEEAGYEYEVPSIGAVFRSVNEIRTLAVNANKAIKDWETEKQAKLAEKQELEQAKSKTIATKTRKERQAIAKDFLNKFIDSDDAELLIEDHGYEETANAVISSHNTLTDMLDDPEKAPSYDAILEAYTKAALYDKLIQTRRDSGKIAKAEVKKAKLDSAGTKTTPSDDATDDPNLKRLRALGVKD